MTLFLSFDVLGHEGRGTMSAMQRLRGRIADRGFSIPTGAKQSLQWTHSKR